MLKKILCILLASVTIAGTLLSCGTAGEGPTDTRSPESEDATAPAETREPLDIPATRYDGTELVLLTRGDEGEWTTLEIYSAGISSDSDNINNAVYERNLRIYETYGVTVRELPKNKNEHLTAVTNEIAGNNGDFRAIITNTPNSASLASQGTLWDLSGDGMEHLHLNKSWWDQNLVENMSIHDRLYFATGDLLTSDNDATYVMLFNKTIAASIRLPDLYAEVDKHTWTMAAFCEYATRAVQDRDGVDGLSYNRDIAGYAYNSSSPSSFLLAGDITLCTKNEEDYPLYSLNVERMQGISEIGKRIFDKGHAVYMDELATDGLSLAEVGQVCFGEDHALFLGEVMQSVTRMRGYSVDFGILPFPMYDAAQGQYRSMMHQTASMVSIPKNVVGEDLIMTTSMLEAMAYHSVDTLTVQYYDINLKSKGAKDEKSGPMIDRILENRAFDLSYYYNLGSNAFGQMAGTLLPSSSKSVASLNRTIGKDINGDIKKVVEAMDRYSD